MKEPEYTLSADNTNWMETSVISDIPFKITIIDPRDYIESVKKTLMQLQSVKDIGFSKDAMDHFGRMIILNVINGIVNNRAAWKHGHDWEVILRTRQLRELSLFDIEFDLREGIRDELNQAKNEKLSTRLENILKDIRADLETYMNPNPYVVHRITHSRDFRTLNLEEFADWRVIQWTLSEQEKIDARHEDI